MSPRSSKGLRMKTVNKTKEKSLKTIKKPKVKPKKEKVLIVAQEIKFARLLSGNEKKTRDRVLKTFKKWLVNCFSKGYEFKEDDFTRVWKGLFYAVWMSDKPLVQEELCETIASILDLFPPEHIKYALMMTKAGFKVLATEWYGIDQHRIDKFLMLVRRYLRGSLRCLKRCEWSLASCKMFADMLSGPDGVLCPKTPLYARNAGSMLLHIVDCFLEELSKVSEGVIEEASVAALLRPMSEYAVKGQLEGLVQATRQFHTALLRQSNQGIEYQEKTDAWKRMGCPRGGPEALELASDDEEQNQDSDDEEEQHGERPLDPRAGRVDVVLTPVPVPAAMLADGLRELLAGASSKTYKWTRMFLHKFEKLSLGEYPLRVGAIPRGGGGPPRAAPAARRLRALERALVQSADELALRGLSRRHRKRLLARARAGLSIVPDAATPPNGNWEVETMETARDTDENKIDTSNKENVHKLKKSKKRKSTDIDNNKDSKKHKSSEEINHSDKETKTQNVKKSFEKHTKLLKNKKDKKQNIVNGFKETQIVPSDVKHSEVKEKTNINKRLNDGKHKKDKENTPKNNEKITKKIPETKPNKVLSKSNKPDAEKKNVDKTTSLVVNKVKNYQKKTTGDKNSPQKKVSYDSPKKVKFVLKNNSMQKPVDYYKSVRQSPNIPFDSSKRPSKTNLKVSTPSPINPFFKKKLRLK